VLCWVIVSSLTCLSASGQNEDSLRRQAEQRAEARLRGYRQLNLEDEQQARLRQLWVDEELAIARLRQQTQQRSQELLDTRQRTTLERQQRIANAPSNKLSWLGLDTQRFTRALSLNDRQQEEVERVLAGAVQRLDEAYQKQRQDRERWDYAAWRGFALQLRSDFRPRIAELLDEQQRAKFEQANREWDEQVAKVYQEWLARQSSSQAPTAGSSPTPSQAEREQALLSLLEQVLAALALGDEERAVLRPLLERLIRTQSDGERVTQEQRQAMARLTREAASEQVIRSALDQLRKHRAGHLQDLETQQAAIRELVTIEQEAVLVAYGLLP
jgi:hypothetical protein